MEMKTPQPVVYGYDPMNRRIWKEQYRDKTGQLLAPAMRTHFPYADEGMLAEATQTLEIHANHSISASHVPVISNSFTGGWMQSIRFQ